ncbi:MAG: TFIIB-type zinc finger domain-containing protein [Clostridia bacterium]|nr:TFIIB-type zinc finger domain-containing protein [Clostridia bacterium]
MIVLICEKCGGHDFVEENGVFVCQSCGAKHIPEDTKKTTDQTETSKKLSNLYERARKSIEVNDLTHAAEYYKQILDEDPSNWEAYFYTYLGEFTSFTNAQAPNVARKLGNTLPSACDMAVADCDDEEALKRLDIISKHLSNRLVGIADGAAALLHQHENYFIFSAAGKVHNDLYRKLRPLVVETICACSDTFSAIDNKLLTIFKERNLTSKPEYNSILLYLRASWYNMINKKFAPTSDVKEYLISAEYIV